MQALSQTPLGESSILLPSLCRLFRLVADNEFRLIFEDGELIWVYSRSHTYPQYIGAGVYDKLARLFLIENAPMVEVEVDDAEPS